MFREIDEDGSGIVSLAEFKEASVCTSGDGQGLQQFHSDAARPSKIQLSATSF